MNSMHFIGNTMKTVFVLHLVLLIILIDGKPHKPQLSGIISSSKPKTTPNPMQTPDKSIFGKTSDNVGDSDVIQFVAPKKNDHRLVRSANADNGPNSDMTCEYLPETVVLNHDSIVEFRYALFYHDPEDVLTDKQLIENKADMENTKKNRAFA